MAHDTSHCTTATKKQLSRNMKTHHAPAEPAYIVITSKILRLTVSASPLFP